MKKPVAHMLIMLLLLNVMGYYGLFVGIKYQHTADFTKRLDDSNYSESETVTLKVPVTIPYYGDTKYERVDGEIEYNGQFYRLVKQKLEKDTLYIVCLKDLQSKRIKQALADYVKNFSEHSSDNTSKVAPSFIKDYINTEFKFLSSNAGWTQDLQFGLTEQQVKEVVLTNLSPPPEA
jgi:hypothetical protein